MVRLYCDNFIKFVSVCVHGKLSQRIDESSIVSNDVRHVYTCITPFIAHGTGACQHQFHDLKLRRPAFFTFPSAMNTQNIVQILLTFRVDYFTSVEIERVNTTHFVPYSVTVSLCVSDNSE